MKPVSIYLTDKDLAALDYVAAAINLGDSGDRSNRSKIVRALIRKHLPEVPVADWRAVAKVELPGEDDE